MADLAVIGLGVDTTDLKDGKIALTEFAATGEATEKRLKSSMRGVTGSVKGVSTEAVKSSAGLRNFALQLGQVGQQGAVTGNYIQALAVQLPDMALGFGTAGALIGVAAAALTPLIAGLAGGASGAEGLEDAIDGLNDSLKEYKRAVDQAEFDSLIDTFGAITPEIIAMARELQELRIREVMLDAAEAARALGEQFEAGFFSTAEQQIKSALGVTIEQAERLEFLFRQIGNADTLSDQIAAIDMLQAGILEATGGIENMDASQLEFYNSTLDAERALRAAEAAAGGVAGAMGGAADEAGRFAVNAIAALNAANAQAAKDELVYGGRGADPRLFGEGGSRSGSGGRFTPSRSTSRRGGRSAVDDFTRRLEALQDQLRTEREVIDEWYEEGQDLLNSRRAKELLDEQEHKEALTRLELEYHSRIANIRDASNDSALDGAATFFGEMADLFQHGGDKMLRISKSFAAAEALINTWKGYTDALAQGGLTPWAKFAWGAKILSAGFGAINAIKGVSAGGGGGGGGSPRASGGGGGGGRGGKSRGTYFNVSLVGGNSIDKSQVRDLISMINEAIEDGAVLKGIRVT